MLAAQAGRDGTASGDMSRCGGVGWGGVGWGWGGVVVGWMG